MIKNSTLKDKIARDIITLNSELNPTQGSEQAGVRPVILFQEETITHLETIVLFTLGYEF